MPDRTDSARIPPPVAPTPDAAGEFHRLVEIMRVLRGPGGCPWDHQQNWHTLTPYVLEEAYEVVDAIERGDVEDLREEIGDLVFEGVFLAQVARDEGHFTIADALRAVSDKLVRRHPHVFIQPDPPLAPGHGISTPDAVVDQWERIKARERAGEGKARPSVLDGIPRAMPALTLAHELGARAASVGFDWPDAPAVLEKVREEIVELEAEVAQDRAERVAEELGDVLFALAQFARKAGLDPEATLRAANTKFGARFRALEREVASRGCDMSALSLEELEMIWQELKGTG